MDEVDRIVAAWRRERPETDVSPMEVLSRVTRLAKHLDRLRKQAFAAQGLEPWEFDVLAALRRAGDPYELSAGQLVTATMVTSGTMTNRVDRLQGKGLVERRPAPSDRRGVLVRLTTAGRERVDAALDELMHHESRLLADLPAADRESIASSLRVLTQPFSE
ncbi:MarR family transcriptional regulator [Aeromicrobium phragmitis]|uniref:MarR family transcriptional regulator n=1 Tax=Aeromicrobium phragmitis TaxID=2478914 RepID=A0A3L8PMK2_9ACTN|nr:MarR family transcriptional regulator [Aeromicrobium phragmitis]RLV56575.1 MarR family transcriptional regulator [Aeromicrobium phragmitis]